MCGETNNCTENRKQARTKIETLTDAVTALTVEIKNMRADANRRDVENLQRAKQPLNKAEPISQEDRYVLITKQLKEIHQTVEQIAAGNETIGNHINHIIKKIEAL